MRYIIITALLMFTLSANAGVEVQSIQQQLKETPEMSKRCIQKISYYQKKVSKINVIPKNERRAIHKIKLAHYNAELDNWTSYCSKPIQQ